MPSIGGVVPRSPPAPMPSAWTARWRPRWRRGVALRSVDAIAVTAGPGLIGGVLSGVMTAKGLAMGLGKPLIGVNHLAGHALTPRLTDGARFPTCCCWCRAGIARSCVSMTGTPSPVSAAPSTTRRGGLRQGRPAFWVCRSPGAVDRGGGAQGRSGPVRLPPTAAGQGRVRHVLFRPQDGRAARPGRADAGQGGLTEGDRADICAGFQAGRGRCSGREDGSGARGQPDHRACRGGRRRVKRHVARRLERWRRQAKLPLLAPPLALCTDNAAMIAYAGLLSYEAGVFSDMTLAARAALAARHDGGPAWSGRAARGPRHDAAGGLRRGRLRVRACDDLCGGGSWVTLWARAGADRIAETREVPRLPGVRSARQRPRDADPRIEADIALIAVPTQSMARCFRRFIPARRSSSPAPRAST
jgi:N6-L-threonylcarbamoyladenine synthase